jgi:hypothetical protein
LFPDHSIQQKVCGSNNMGSQNQTKFGHLGTFARRALDALRISTKSGDQISPASN